MKYLFLGGVADGEWLETDGRDRWVVPVPRELDEGFLEEPEMKEMKFEVNEYFLFRLAWSNGEGVVIYVFEGEKNPLARLRDGYRVEVRSRHRRPKHRWK